MLKVTFAGVDETVGIDKLVGLKEDFPHIELAVLISEKNSGTTLRYPSANYLNHFSDAISDYAVHLCGACTEKFNTWGDKFKFYNVCKKAKRIQVNKKCVIEQLKAFKTVSSFYPESTLIQPVTQFTHGLPGNVHLLLDNSGGRGIFSEFWPAPLPDRICGYAGGISDLNIEEVLHRIKALVPDSSNTWIDMESGIRDINNKIDFGKLKEICEAVYDS